MRRERLAAWLISVLAGVVAAFATLTFGIRGLTALVAFGVAAGLVAQRLEALAGLLVGLGGTGVVVLFVALSRCSSAGEGRASCLAPAGSGLVVAAAVLAAGVAITLYTLRRGVDN